MQIKVIFHSSNKGKGAALRTGFREATGDICIVQDADLEYDPKEFIWYRFANSDLVESEKIVIIFAVAQDCEEVSYENLEEGVTPECNEDMYEGGEFTYFAVNGDIKSFSEFKD